MVRFIDQHRDTYGVEPICAVLPIAPSTFYRRKAQQHDAEQRSARARRDDDLRAAIASIAGKIGCTAETLRKWVRRRERDEGKRAGLTTDERLRLRDLEREVRELRRANEILRKASAFFAQAELDRRPK